MERKLATVRQIADIKPIKGADAIELAKIDGWQVVIAKKDNFKIGDKVIFMEIDSVLPELPEFEFLRKNKFRIKTIKLRKQLSQGIAFPFSIMEKFPRKNIVTAWGDPPIFSEEDATFSWKLGDDVTTAIGITKYEPPISAELAGQVRGGFPGQVPKTDEERVQNLVEPLEYWKKSESFRRVYGMSEKLDGSSATFINLDDDFHTCSKNLDLLESENNTFWKMAKKYDLQKLMKGRNIAIQGELIGPGIQKNKYKLSEHEIFFFKAFDINEQKYLPKVEFIELMENMELKIVPDLGELLLENQTVEDFVNMAEGKSVLNPAIEREGIVFSTKYDTGKNYGVSSFKAINNRFLLKYED